MKTVILNESQVKRLIDKIVSEKEKTLKLEQYPKEKRNRRAEKDALDDLINEGERINWKGKYEGIFNFTTKPGAYNVGTENYKIGYRTSISSQGRYKPGTETPSQETPGEEKTPTLSTFIVDGSSLPYADNMVKPYFDKYPNALAKFDEIVAQFSNYIKNGGGPNLTNVTIQGSADSYTPNKKVPTGYSRLDHPDPNNPFNGITDPKEMNQWLADTRASEYAKVLSAKIKELTGFDLVIKVLKGINYYGQEGKRGSAFRSIVLRPNAVELKKTETPPAKTEPTVTPGTTSPGQTVKISNKPYEVVVYKDGEGSYMDGFDITETNGTQFKGIKRESVESLGLPLLAAEDVVEYNSKIVDNKFYVDNKLVGDIQSAKNLNEDFKNSFPGLRFYAGPITSIRAYRTHEIEGQGKVTVGYLNEITFLFF